MRSRKKPIKTEAAELVSAAADTNSFEAGTAERDNSKKLKIKKITAKPASQKSENSTKHEANQMNKLSGQSDNEILAEIPELDEILELPKNVREEAFVRAVCTAHKAKLKANKKVKQNLAWLHTESEN